MPAKRIKFKIDGKLASILRSDWDVLKRRFNQENAKEGHKQFEIQIKCPLCPKFLSKDLSTCKGCTFNKFEKEQDGSGCWEVIKIVLRESPKFTPSERCVYFFKTNASRSRVQLNKLLAFMEKKEEENDAA